jgi:ABC-type transport system substrate-binding protein
VLADARRTGRFDYDRPIEGVVALDRYTLRLRFDQPDYVFANWLTYVALAAVAREVVEAKRDPSNRVMDYPVGTGAYRLEQWVRGQRIVLAGNPGFRAVAWPAPPAGDPVAAATARGLAGRKLPLVDRVEISILEEAEPRLLTFESGQLDYVELPSSLAGNVLRGDALKPEYQKLGIALHRQIEPSIGFTFFNLDDPQVGGYTNEKLALRRAIALAYDRDAAIRLLFNGQAVPATQPVPPGLAGHDEKIPARAAHDPATARALLERFGYRDRDGDGYREAPDGSPLTLVKGSTTSNTDRTVDELWKKSMATIGLRVRFLKNKWPELNKMSEAGQLMMWNLGWISSIPDGDTFYSLLYSGNIGTSNDARLRLPEYDRIYLRARMLPDGPERSALYRQLTQIVLIYTPWILGEYPYSNILVQPWVRGFRQHPLLRHQWMYYDVDRG